VKYRSGTDDDDNAEHADPETATGHNPPNEDKCRPNAFAVVLVTFEPSLGLGALFVA
jgi:hypothetical protein